MLLMLRSTTVGPRVVYVVDVSPGNFLNAWKSFHADRYERVHSPMRLLYRCLGLYYMLHHIRPDLSTCNACHRRWVPLLAMHATGDGHHW
jgi:hypothetical protein